MPHGKQQAELYDLAADPSESKDIIGDHPNIAKRLTQIVCGVRNDTGYWKDLAWMKPADYHSP